MGKHWEKTNEISSAKSCFLVRPFEQGKYIEERILPQIKYYASSSRRFQREYYVISIINLIVLALIPLLTMLTDNFPFFKYVVAAVSAIASILSSILLLRRSKDNWLDYRLTAETLKSELVRYRTNVGEYSKKGQESEDVRLSLFVENCESIMKSGHSGWHSRMQEDSGQE